jgi:hypothetical protein
MPSKATSEALSAHWRQLVDAWRNSGQSQRAFCREQDLIYEQFVYWRRKFEQQGNGAASRPSSALVPVIYQPELAEHGLSLVLPNGIEVRGIASDNLPLVEQLVVRLS